jgi:predicted  nucleic acid-binding Zn-ribbon protein
MRYEMERELRLRRLHRRLKFTRYRIAYAEYQMARPSFDERQRQAYEQSLDKLREEERRLTETLLSITQSG